MHAVQELDRPLDPPRHGPGLLSLARPSGWKRLRLWGASSRARHVRRRADLITLGVALLALAIILPGARRTDGLEQEVLGAIAVLPPVLDPVLAITYDLLAVFAVLALVLALVRRQWRLTLRLLAVVPAGIAVSVLANRALGLGATVGDLQVGAPVDGIPVQLVLALGVASVASREMSRPFRTAGRRLVLASSLAALLLPVGPALRVIAALLLGVIAASIARLALGSPVTSVSANDVRDDLADLGVRAEPVPDWAHGVHEAVDEDGARLTVRVLGRDEWDNQLATTIWRFLWYRNSTARLLLGPRQRVEHHAFLSLLAQARGAAVAPVVAAGASRTGDALVATRITGTPLADLDGPLDDALLDRCWAALASLHDAGVAHGGIDAVAVEVDGAGTVHLTSFARAEALVEPAQVHADRAQLLVTTALLVGTERAVAAALRSVVGDAPDEADPLVSFLQTAALGDDLRAQVGDADLDLEELRRAMAEAAGREVPDLQKIWRVSWGAIVRLALLGLVGYLLISQLADIGWDTIVESVDDADPVLLAAALVLGQLPRVATAASLRTASPAPVPLGRVTRLQFATTFINLAVPSTAARVATSIRFFQRSGATPAAALSAGALDSFAGFIVQVSLLGGLLLSGFGTLGFDGMSTDQVDRAQLLRVVLLLVGAVGLVGATVLAVPALRARASGIVEQLKEALSVLRSPAAVVRLLAFNVLAEVLFATTIWVVLRAFGQEVSIIDVIIINEAVALFAGLMPVPGGVGVTEGALTAGFVAAGVPEATAFSAALAYRLCTFYLPPLWGYLAMRSLRKDGYL
jgi:uncharacterized membrane protein YbhN (UPF0104 family)